ncbi:PAS domain S-box protein [Cellvibrio mixtus]|uniref:PAS domain S-box protein n=1 Tax=Cellvibrio mixtus TaxID=39650 RepID=UPI000694229A|nr:PAS domain S-box protein [Cellvibrio mixtus]
MKAPFPDNEAERLACLYRLDVLDTPPEQAFDELVQLAAMICNVPVAVVSLVDEKRQWFKAAVGLDSYETSRDLAFCAHAILDPNQVMVVEDATLDPRFIDNCLVTQAPGIRFYAGAPLRVSEGIALGTLCIIDWVPRKLSPQDKLTLELLARQVERLFLLHQRNTQIRHQAEQFEVLSNAAPLLVGELDAQQRYIFVNHKYKKWFGLEPEQLLGRTPVEIGGENAYIQFQSHLSHCYGSGERVSFECWVNDDLYLKITFIPVKHQEQVKGVFVLGTDVSHLKRHERELEHERASLASVISGTDAGTWRWNVQTGETQFNDRWTSMLGYRLDELDARSVVTWRELLHPDDREKVKQVLDRYFAGELSNYESKFRMRHKDGHWVWIQSRGRITDYTADGQPEWMSGTHLDITLAEESLHAMVQSQKKLASLYNLSPVAITLNRMATGEFIECNPEFCKLTGYTREELAGMSYWQLTPKEYRLDESEQLEALHISGRYGPYEKHYIHKNGQLVAVLLNGVVIEGENGERQIWSIVQDITERKRIEQMKNDFVSTISHELRTPLTAISGALGVVVSGMLGELPETVKNMLTIAHKNSLRLTLLINDLLDMEKLLAGKMEFELRVQPLLPIVQQSLEGNSSYADTFGVGLVLQTDLTNEQVLIDAQRLQQVLANLISNAVKFSSSQGQVEIVVNRQHNHVKIAVVDHGPGVSEEFRTRIFQKFSQADSSDSRRRGGTGLGLAISKAFVERMQGTIGFDSEPGKGATFYAIFPLHERAE